MTNNKNDETWAEYRRLVLAELERLNSEIDKLKAESKARDIRQASLTAKLTVYAAVGAVVGGGILSWILEYVVK